jgi:hypothetical protein
VKPLEREPRNLRASHAPPLEPLQLPAESGKAGEPAKPEKRGFFRRLLNVFK